MSKLTLSRAVVVEGKYDKIKLEALIDGLIIQTNGFRIYKDKEKAAMLRAVARRRGVVIVTDSDRAGFQLRGFVRSVVQDAEVVNVYIPQIAGKEKRKRAPGAEGLLGVEGIDLETLRELFLRAGALDPPGASAGRETSARRITRMDFYEHGLSGGPEAARLRKRLLQRLGLPCYLTCKGLLEVVNSLMTYEEYRAFLKEMQREEQG